MKPKISVIVAAYNEEKLIGKSLAALQKQKYPKEKFEVIVVDNNSIDKTAAISKQMGAHVYPYTDIQACGASREYGVSKARGEILAFTDADAFVPQDWLIQIDAVFKDPTLFMLSGRPLPEDSNAIIKFIFLIYHLTYKINYSFGKPLVWGYNMAIKRSAYEAVGGINGRLLSSEDWDLAIRTQKKFGRGSVRYLSGLQVVTSVRKQNSPQVFYKYAINGIRNYFDLVIFGKKKAIAVFNVR